MSKSDTFENDLLKLIFNGTAISNMADNAGTSPLTTLYVSLHTADPGEAGNQTTSEISTTAYVGYTRVAVARDTVSTPRWVVTGNSVSPNATISFPACTGSSGSSNVVTYFAVGTASTGTGKILYSGTVSPSVTVTTGVTPQLTTATAITED